MKKIGIVTLYYKNLNFGGLLQAYALPQAIRIHLHRKCEQIAYDCQRRVHIPTFFETVISADKNIAGIKKIVKKAGADVLNNLYKKKLLSRRRKFVDFSNAICHSQTIYTDETIKTSCGNYFAVICGGDQIWNDWGEWLTDRAAQNFSLQFVKAPVRKISYAPSLGNGQLSSEFCQKIQPGLTELDFISVREKSSVSVVEKMSGKPVSVVLDPVLLLTKEDWDKIAKGPYSAKERYTLGYFLGADKKQRKSTLKFARNIQTKTYVFPFIYGNRANMSDLFFGDIRDFTSGPAEFVGLIKSTECVVTDSFHAIVFSLIYHKPFYVFERSTQVGGGTMNSRIHDFLEEFGLQDRLVTPEQLEKKKSIEPIDYTFADKVLAHRRKESYDYLKTALGIQNEV